jgi:hypothetical protein
MLGQHTLAESFILGLTCRLHVSVDTPVVPQHRNVELEADRQKTLAGHGHCWTLMSLCSIPPRTDVEASGLGLDPRLRRNHKRGVRVGEARKQRTKGVTGCTKGLLQRRIQQGALTRRRPASGPWQSSRREKRPLDEGSCCSSVTCDAWCLRYGPVQT